MVHDTSKSSLGYQLRQWAIAHNLMVLTSLDTVDALLLALAAKVTVKN